MGFLRARPRLLPSHATHLPGAGGPVFCARFASKTLAKLFLYAPRPVCLICVCACNRTQTCFARARSCGRVTNRSRPCVSGRSRLGKVDAPTLEFRQLRSHSNQSFVNCDSHLRHSRCARNGNVSTVTLTVCSPQAHRRRPFYRLCFCNSALAVARAALAASQVPRRLGYLH